MKKIKSEYSISWNKCIFLLFFIASLSSCNSKKDNYNLKEKKKFNDSTKLSKKPQIKANSLNLQDLTDSLYYFMKQATDNKSKIKQIKFEKLFFNYFPNNFQKMENWLNNNGAKFSIKRYEQKGEILSFFNNLTRIDKKKYYTKYINICINGKYEADYIEKGFGLANKILEDSNHIIPLLNKRTDKEVKSIFKFIIEDAEKPDKDLYNRLYKIFSKKNKRLARLLKEVYLYETSLIL